MTVISTYREKIIVLYGVKYINRFFYKLYFFLSELTTKESATKPHKCLNSVL